MSHLPYVSVVVSTICVCGSVQQYWAGNPDAYEFVGVSQLAEAFQKSGISSEADGEEDLEKGKKKQGSASDEGRDAEGLDPLVHEKYVALLLLVLSCCQLFSLLICYQSTQPIGSSEPKSKIAYTTPRTCRFYARNSECPCFVF